MTRRLGAPAGAVCAALVALAPASAETRPPGKERALAMAKALLAALPKAPRGWRVGKAPYFPDRTTAADQGEVERWRYVPEAARFYIAGRGAGAKRIQITAQYAPRSWIVQKRRQIRYFQKRAPYCVSTPKIGDGEAYLMGSFGKAGGKAATCATGARLVVLKGQVIVTVDTGQNVGGAGLALARAVDYAAMARLEP